MLSFRARSDRNPGMKLSPFNGGQSWRGSQRTHTWSPVVQAFFRPPCRQPASRGFGGIALTAQTGDKYFALVGFGRTNLKPYANLNFDPNDAITLAAGWCGEGSARPCTRCAITG
jgi:hypothetical protein